jgi:phage-related protein/DNA-binding transcriptional regulator YiaG
MQFDYDDWDDFIKELAKLPRKEQAKMLGRITKIEKYGLMMAFQKQWIKKVDDNLFEIRIHFSNGISRSIYFRDALGRYVITQTFIKKTQRTPKSEIKKQDVEGGATMTPAEKMIEAISKADPQFKQLVEHYQQQDDFAVEISKLRKKLGLTQQQLADKVRVPQSTIARWESGDGNITIKNMEKIARATHKKLVMYFE